MTVPNTNNSVIISSITKYKYFGFIKVYLEFQAIAVVREQI